MSTNGAAIERNAKPSAQYTLHLAEAQGVLSQATAQYAATSPGGLPTITQASSLGAEDVVITHLINSLQLDIPVFVLETGKLHDETLLLLEHSRQHSRAQVLVFYPKAEAVKTFVAQGLIERRRGDDPASGLDEPLGLGD